MPSSILHIGQIMGFDIAYHIQVSRHKIHNGPLAKALTLKVLIKLTSLLCQDTYNTIKHASNMFNTIKHVGNMFKTIKNISGNQKSIFY